MLQRRTTAQRDRHYAADNAGYLGWRHQTVMLRKDGKLWPSVAEGWVAAHVRLSTAWDFDQAGHRSGVVWIVI